jgi:hypothetical protein
LWNPLVNSPIEMVRLAKGVPQMSPLALEALGRDDNSQLLIGQQFAAILLEAIL